MIATVLIKKGLVTMTLPDLSEGTPGYDELIKVRQELNMHDITSFTEIANATSDKKANIYDGYPFVRFVSASLTYTIHPALIAELQDKDGIAIPPAAGVGNPYTSKEIIEAFNANYI